MDTTMPKDYLTELLQNMQGQLNRLEDKQDSQTATLNEVKELAQTTNGRVNGHDAAIRDIRKKIARKSRLIDRLDNKTIYLIAAIIAIFLLLLLKQLTNIDLTRLL